MARGQIGKPAIQAYLSYKAWMAYSPIALTIKGFAKAAAFTMTGVGLDYTINGELTPQSQSGFTTLGYFAGAYTMYSEAFQAAEQIAIEKTTNGGERDTKFRVFAERTIQAVAAGAAIGLISEGLESYLISDITSKTHFFSEKIDTWFNFMGGTEALHAPFKSLANVRQYGPESSINAGYLGAIGFFMIDTYMDYQNNFKQLNNMIRQNVKVIPTHLKAQIAPTKRQLAEAEKSQHTVE